MRTIVLCSCLMLLAAAPVRAEPGGANTPPLSYRSSGTCVASPEGFNAKLEAVDPGFAWSTTFTSVGSVDERGSGVEVGQALDTASFGAEPRAHTPAAHAYNAVFTASVSEPASDGGVTLRVGPMSGSFSAGPYAGQSFTLSGFDLKRVARDNAADVYGNAPVTQTLSLGGVKKFERVCMLTISTTPGLHDSTVGASRIDRKANP